MMGVLPQNIITSRVKIHNLSHLVLGSKTVLSWSASTPCLSRSLRTPRACILTMMVSPYEMDITPYVFLLTKRECADGNNSDSCDGCVDEWLEQSFGIGHDAATLGSDSMFHVICSSTITEW